MNKNLLTTVKFTRAMNAVATGTTNVNGSVIDMAGFDGIAFCAAFGAILATAVTGIKVQQGTLSDGSNMTDLAGTAISVPDTGSNKMVLTEVYQPLKTFVRIVVTRSVAGAVIDGVMAMQYSAIKQPVTNDAATVVASEIHNSPAEGTA